MKVLNNDEMVSYKGGAKISVGVIGIISGVVAFLLGVIDGIANPKKCNVK